MGKIISICISDHKGTVKHEVDSCYVRKDHGLEGDAHAGSERQVSLLPFEKFKEFRDASGNDVSIVPGVFGENLLVEGLDLRKIGRRFRCGDCILEIMQIGKKCHTGCEISKITGKCIMPIEGVFARVLQGGTISKGDSIDVICDQYKVSVLTASDRAYNGQRDDLSGPAIRDIVQAEGYEVISMSLLPDDEDRLAEEIIRICDELSPDILFTTGGTGLSPRDNMPEATMKAAERNVPGIAEAIRRYSLDITPNAMLSRGVSVMRGKTLIINLPGSPKAVSECLGYILPTLEHGIRIMRGENDGH